MRVVTWNVNSLRARMDRLASWLKYADPDVVCLQETKVQDSGFPYEEIAAMGYHSVHYGVSQWNGVAILSKRVPEEVQIGFIEPWDAQEARIVTARIDGISISSVYVPNGRSLEDAHYIFKLEWLKRLEREVTGRLSRGESVLIAGDFNVAPQDLDVWDPEEFVGATHVSPAERRALEAIYKVGLVDVFRRIYPDQRIYTWWDFRRGAFHKGQGLRIDLILADLDLAARADWGLMDREARKGEKPSDHAPVIIDFQS